MNTRYTETLLFLCRLSRRNNKGFAMGFCLAVGVVMAATGAVMLLRSNSETQKMVAQQATAKGKATGDTAIARMQFFLGKYPFLTEKDIDDWQDTDLEEQLRQANANSCLSESEVTAEVQKKMAEIASYAQKSEGKFPWIEIDSSNKFRINDYEPGEAGTTMGTLTIEAMANVDNDFQESPIKLVLQIPINENDTEIKEGESPGLWVKEGGVDDIVAANVWLGSGGDDCTLTDEELKTKVAEANTNVFDSKGGLQEAIKDGELETGTTFEPAIVAEYKFPDELPDKPTNAISISIASNSDSGTFSTIAHLMNGFVDKAFNNMFGGVALARGRRGRGNRGRGNNNPPPDQNSDTGSSDTGSSGTGSSSGDGCGTQIDAGQNNGFNVYPRPNDSATRTAETADGETICVYDYEISSNIGGEAVIRTVNAEGERQRVIFHLSANITKGADIAHIGNDDLNSVNNMNQMIRECNDPCKPVDFQLFGYSGTDQVCLNGNNKLHAFLWAPYADFGMDGGGNGKGGINGVAFVKTWNVNCGSNSKSGAHVVQTGEWEDLGIESPEKFPPMTIGQPANVRTEQYYSDY